jgi:hypothetical protein
MIKIQNQIVLKELMTMNTQSNLFTNKRIGETRMFSAPLGALKKGRLEIIGGISNGGLRGDPAIQELFQAQFIGQIPEVRTRKESVIIRYPLSLREWFRHLLLANRHAARVMLNTSIPWRIDVHGGIAHLDADLQVLQLSSLVITGGVAETDILLPPPLGTAKIHISSGVSNLTILRPEGVSVHLRVGGGTSELTVDDRFYGSIGGEFRVDTSNYKDATNRYDIRVNGGASNLIIRTLS